MKGNRKNKVSSLTCVNKSSFWGSSRLSFGVQVSAKLRKSHLSLSPSSACIFSFLPFKVLPVTLACRNTIMVSVVFSTLQPVKLYTKWQYLLKIKENIYTVDTVLLGKWRQIQAELFSDRTCKVNWCELLSPTSVGGGEDHNAPGRMSFKDLSNLNHNNNWKMATKEKMNVILDLLKKNYLRMPLPLRKEA